MTVLSAVTVKVVGYCSRSCLRNSSIGKHGSMDSRRWGFLRKLCGFPLLRCKCSLWFQHIGRLYKAVRSLNSHTDYKQALLTSRFVWALYSLYRGKTSRPKRLGSLVP